LAVLSNLRIREYSSQVAPAGSAQSKRECRNMPDAEYLQKGEK